MLEEKTRLEDERPRGELRNADIGNVRLLMKLTLEQDNPDPPTEPERTRRKRR